LVTISHFAKADQQRCKSPLWGMVDNILQPVLDQWIVHYLRKGDILSSVTLIINTRNSVLSASEYSFQWRSQREGLGVQPPIRIETVFFTAVKLLLLNIITSL